MIVCGVFIGLCIDEVDEVVDMGGVRGVGGIVSSTTGIGGDGDGDRPLGVDLFTSLIVDTACLYVLMRTRQKPDRDCIADKKKTAIL